MSHTLPSRLAGPPSQGVAKPGLGNKPCLLFQGHCWEQNVDFQNAQSMLADFFRGQIITNLFLGVCCAAFSPQRGMCPGRERRAPRLSRRLPACAPVLTISSLVPFSQAGIDRVIVFSAEPPRIRMQQYLISFKKSGTRLPIVQVRPRLG